MKQGRHQLLELNKGSKLDFDDLLQLLQVVQRTSNNINILV